MYLKQKISNGWRLVFQLSQISVEQDSSTIIPSYLYSDYKHLIHKLKIPDALYYTFDLQNVLKNYSFWIKKKKTIFWNGITLREQWFYNESRDCCIFRPRVVHQLNIAIYFHFNNKPGMETVIISIDL